MNSAGMRSPGPTSRLSLAAGSKPSPAVAPWTYPRLRSLGANSLVVAILSPFLALTSGYASKVLLAIVILDIPIQLGTTLFLRPHEADFGALKGLSISATTLALAGLYASWLIRTMAKRTPEARPPLHINWPLVFYFAITILSMLVAQDLALSLFEVYLLLEACLVYFYVANTVRTREGVLFVLRYLMIGGLFESLVIIVMKFTVTPSTPWNMPIHIIAEFTGRDGGMRLGGTIGVPNVAGAYLSILLASAASLLLTNLGPAYKWLAKLVLGLGGVALIYTFSRGGWIALALAVIVLCFVAWRQRGFSLRVPIAILAILTLLYLPFHGVISERMFGDDKGSAESRIPLNKLAFRMIEDNPVMGVGANNFTVAMDRYVTAEFRHDWLFAVHNKYLLVLAETGIGGLLAYLAFLLGTMRTGWKCWRFQDPLFSPLGLGFAVGIAGHMVHLTVDLFHVRPIQQLLWLLAGLLAAMHRMCTQPPAPDSLSKIAS
ncbi:MAG: hypothetical protein DMG49_27950 [Acidobacteria bacterium]|nr:MAG: hypothetical protein DMG49_27950 [Acidobacteriota bacterium]